MMVAALPLVIIIGLAGVLSALQPYYQSYLRKDADRRIRLQANSELYTSVDKFVGLRPFESPAFLDRLQLARSMGVNAPGEHVDSLLGVMQALLTVGGFSTALAVLDPWIAGALIAAASLPALLAETSLSRRRASVISATSQAERRGLFYASLLTDAQAAREIRLFGTGQFFRRRMLVEFTKINDAQRQIDRRSVVAQGALAAFSAVVAVVLLLWAVSGVSRGALVVGDVVLTIAAVASTQAGLGNLVTNFVAARFSLEMFDHYVSVVQAPTDLPIRDQAQIASQLQTGIELKDVWFRYADDQPWVLRGVSLCIRHGATTALVGLNGAGKTTLISLLCRFYDPQRGSISWDGVDLRDLDPRSLRSRIRAVFQEPTAYDLTARENILLGDTSAHPDDARVVEASQEARAHDFISALPHGYDTLLTRVFSSDRGRSDSQSGLTLSGGQWQRLALARALLLRNPDLLILDEPSSALDAEAEYKVHQELGRRRVGRTTFLISHRLNVVRSADHIVVLADGEIVQTGGHDELVHSQGPYADLFSLQAHGYREDEPAANG